MIGVIKLFAGNYAPRGWAFCHGQIVSTETYPELYSILENFYGGNGDGYFRSDALVMLKNGNTQLNGNFTVDGSISQTGTGVLHADYVFESYYDGVLGTIKTIRCQA